MGPVTNVGSGDRAPRRITRSYVDPLDRVWIATAERLGLEVKRDDSAYASTDGRGTLTVGTAASLDPDDCLAQIIFHELCHALVQGDASFGQPDWGLDNTTDRDVFRERACLRVQASLSQRYGLRQFLAPTTEYRAFYEALAGDPLDGDPGDTSVSLARSAIGRAETPPWQALLHAALSATATITSAASPFASSDDLLVDAPGHRAGRHPVGALLGPAGETCATCAWRYRGPGGHDRCRLAGARTDRAYPSCEHWQAPHDCRACGACCRDAYHLVEIGRREPVVHLHPHLVTQTQLGWVLRRNGTLCAALTRDASGYTCTIYGDRPRTCRDFEVGGRNCLEARQRVGLTARFRAPAPFLDTPKPHCL